ncbi:hypothetical protein FAIPA1_200081 [Frankia sp. AiPs1]
MLLVRRPRGQQLDGLQRRVEVERAASPDGQQRIRLVERAVDDPAQRDVGAALANVHPVQDGHGRIDLVHVRGPDPGRQGLRRLVVGIRRSHHRVPAAVVHGGRSPVVVIIGHPTTVPDNHGRGTNSGQLHSDTPGTHVPVSSFRHRLRGRRTTSPIR